MSTQRRIGSVDSATRSRLLDAAAELMREEGHHAVTVRRLAEHASVKRQIVHYYFRSMEELFLEVVRRAAERYLVRQKAALEGPEPLRGLWELMSSPEGNRLEIEYSALGNRLASVRQLRADYTTRMRELQSEALQGLLPEPNVEGISPPGPEALIMIMRAVARTASIEADMGVTRGHAEALQIIEQFLAAYATAAQSADSRTARESQPSSAN